jgi:hypothetical protein
MRAKERHKNCIILFTVIGRLMFGYRTPAFSKPLVNADSFCPKSLRCEMILEGMGKFKISRVNRRSHERTAVKVVGGKYGSEKNTANGETQ